MSPNRIKIPWLFLLEAFLFAAVWALLGLAFRFFFKPAFAALVIRHLPSFPIASCQAMPQIPLRLLQESFSPLYASRQENHYTRTVMNFRSLWGVYQPKGEVLQEAPLSWLSAKSLARFEAEHFQNLGERAESRKGSLHKIGSNEGSKP